MANNETVLWTELPNLVDDGTHNNYGEWQFKSHHKLCEWDLLKYIEGPTSDPPIIPPLRQTVTYHGVDDNGHPSTVRVLGNATEHQQALVDAQPWLAGNKTALSRIRAALPSHQLHLARVEYAKQVWENLRSVYQLQNSRLARNTERQIMTYRCTSDMDVFKWLDDMHGLYSSLCDLDIEWMSDRDFALAIVNLMPQDDSWTVFASSLRTKVHESDMKGLPLRSMTFSTAIHDQYWLRRRDDPEINSQIFSARFEAQKRSAATLKRPRAADPVTTSSIPKKRARGPNPIKANLRCINPYCGSKIGYDTADTADCITYKGNEEGQYGDW